MNPPVDLAELDTVAIGRGLSQIADRDGDVVDAFFERREEVELPPEGEAPGLRVWHEEGLAVRLLRGGRTWLAARDAVDAEAFQGAVRQVARALPATSYPAPRFRAARPAPAAEAPEVLAFPAAVKRHLERLYVGLPLRLTVRRHRRWTRVIGSRLAADPQQELFYSCVAELPWARHGSVLERLDEGAAAETVEGLMGLYRGREAPAVAAGRAAVVLAPAAAAVLLHEAVAHALETDTLALSGRPEAALGVRIGPPALGVLDDPSTLPRAIRRTADDEGMPVVRRWLVREGAVEQPLADRFAAAASRRLSPGAGRRGSRHQPPVPRSSHLELVPGEAGLEELLGGAEGGLYAPLASRGRLDPLRGDFSLEIPFARRVHEAATDGFVGPFRLSGRVAELLDAVTGVGAESRFAGAGWCAKGGQKLPVWATAPALLLEGVAIS
jgi:predicted Zn-dependent protease